MILKTRLDRALLSLDGLSVGDAFGERFFGEPRDAIRRISERQLTPGPWAWTDDTEMACALVEHLAEHGEVYQDALAQRFAERMDPHRGYGRSAYDILTEIRRGKPWRRLSGSAFRGRGSFGNGAAMRVAPLGAFFAEDTDDRIAEQARLSAEITHTHEEGIAGAVAVALAAAVAFRARSAGRPLTMDALRAVLERVPPGYTRDGVAEALGMADADIFRVAEKLGNGSGITSPDTVPLCFWAAGTWGDDFEQAMWGTVSALGDRDTTCAIVGGILAGFVGRDSLPTAWLAAREPLPEAIQALGAG